MALAHANKSHEISYTLDDAMDILLTKLDDAIEDMETGRVQTIEKHGMRLMKYKVPITEIAKEDMTFI